MGQLEQGIKAEDLACQFLENNGYEIVIRNYRFKKSEIDIIARINGILVFIEVKSRRYFDQLDPSARVDGKKKKLVMDAASQFMIEVGHDWEIRFDIISIQWDNDNNANIRHYLDAFFK